MAFPTPTTVHILAEVSEFLMDEPTAGAPETLCRLATYAGMETRARNAVRLRRSKAEEKGKPFPEGEPDFSRTRADERRAMVALAAQAIARIETLDNLKENS